MKKYSLFILLVLLLISCSGSNTNTSSIPPVSPDSPENNEEVVVAPDSENTPTENIKENTDVTSSVESGQNLAQKKTFHIENLKKVTENESESYSGVYLTGMRLETYDTTHFEKDIQSKGTDLQANHIQTFSKETDFKKEDFEKLFSDFEQGNFAQALESLNKNEKLNPFYYGLGDYNFLEVYNNGILGFVSEQGALSFYYLTYGDNKVYLIRYDSSRFGIDYDKNVLVLGDTSIDVKTFQSSPNEPMNMEKMEEVINSYFKGTKSDSAFQKLKNTFQSEIDHLFE